MLGSILFLIFINDLPDNIRSSVRLLVNEGQCGQIHRVTRHQHHQQILFDYSFTTKLWKTFSQQKTLV